MNKKRYVEKFVQNKKLPNSTFTLTDKNGKIYTIDLNSTVQKIYETGQGQEVRKILKKGMFRNASVDKCLKLFEGAAQRFLLDQIGEETSKRIQDILEKAHRRKKSLFITIQENKKEQTYEVIFIDKDEKVKPYLLKNIKTEAVRSFDKKTFIEFLLRELENISKVL